MLGLERLLKGSLEVFSSAFGAPELIFWTLFFYITGIRSLKGFEDYSFQGSLTRSSRALGF